MPRAARRAPKAYNNLEFLNSPDARTVRILCEFLEPLNRFRDHNIKGTIVFFGSCGILPEQQAKARSTEVQKEVASARNANRSLLTRLQQAKNQVKMSRYHTEALRLARGSTRACVNTEPASTQQFAVRSFRSPGNAAHGLSSTPHCLASPRTS